MIGVYSIRNILNGKMYIGSSANIDYRFYQHKFVLRKGEHENPHLQASWNKYGEVNFEFKVLVLCNLGEELYHEQMLCNKLRPILYNKNLMVFKPPSQKGKKQTAQHIHRRVASRKRGGYTMSEENRKKISERCKGIRTTNEWKMTRVAQIDMVTGECVNVYSSLMNAGKSVNLENPKLAASNISRCLQGYNDTAFGYHWLYWDKITPPFKGQSKRVKLID